MTNREKLLNILQSQPYGYHTYDEMVDYLIANNVVVQEWISVEDELPEKWRYVLALNEYDEESLEPCVAYIDDKGWIAGGIVGCKITHWIPLPELPKQKKKVRRQ